MSAETPFSSKRFLLALMLAACSVILLQNHSLSENSSFLFELASMAAGLALCFLCFVPALLLRKLRNADILRLSTRSPAYVKLPVAVFYAGYFVYTALYFLIPYTDMFHAKYYPGVSPCLITVVLLGCCVYAAVKGVNVITRFGIFLFLFAMLTNILMFGGNLNALELTADSLSWQGSTDDFWQNTRYFLTPAFIAAVFACLNAETNNFRLRQPLCALLFTGLKYAAVLFFIRFAVGAYAGRQEYPTFVLSRTAHFDRYTGVESFYLALATMSVFMIVSLLLCCVTKAADREKNLKTVVLFTLILLAMYTVSAYVNSVKEILTNQNVFIIFTGIAALLPLAGLIGGRKSNAPTLVHSM